VYVGNGDVGRTYASIREEIMSSAFERARRLDPQPLPGPDGTELAQLICLGRELARDANGAPFTCAVRLVKGYFGLDDLSHASRLLRTLEGKGVLRCIRRDTPTRGDTIGTPTLWEFREPS